MNGIRILCLICVGSVFLFSSLTSQTKEEYVQKGDEYWEKREFRDALSNYLKAHKIAPEDYKILWKCSRTYIEIGKNADERVAENYYRKSLEFAEEAVRIKPDDINCQFWKAAALGKLAQIMGGKEKVEISKQLRDQLDLVLKMDPNHDPAYYIYARLHRAVANLNRVLKAIAKMMYGDLALSTNEEAVNMFQKAISINPDFIEYRFELGRTCVEMKEWEKAREQFNKVLALPSAEAYDELFRNEAKEILDDIKNKG